MRTMLRMMITLDRLSNIEEIKQFNTGIKPRYGKKGSTSRGNAWCSCGKCIGNLLLFPNRMVMGWFETRCRCGNEIDWSVADEYL